MWILFPCIMSYNCQIVCSRKLFTTIFVKTRSIYKFRVLEHPMLDACRQWTTASIFQGICARERWALFFAAYGRDVAATRFKLKQECNMNDETKSETGKEVVVHPDSSDRREFLRRGSALTGAAIMSLVPDSVRHGAWAAGSDAPEKTELKIGFIPLTDCASVVMASVMEFDKKYGRRAR